MQFNSIWLYTLLTIVSTVVSSVGFGQTVAGPNVTAADAERICAGESGSKKLDCIARILHGNGSGGGGSTDECTKLETELRKEQTELTAACQDVGIGGLTSCQQSYANCNEGEFGDDDGDDSGSSLTPGSKNRGSIPREKFKACPSTALDVAKESKEELKELRDDLKDLKEKLAQKKLDIVAVENEITDKNTKFEEDVAEKTKAYNAEVKEKTKNNEGETQELTDKITETSQQLTKMIAQQDTLMIEYIEQIAQIEGICEAEAERELSKKREDQVKALQTSGQKQRSVSELLKLRVSGRSSADEGFRKRAILRCQQNPARYQKPVTLLNNRFEEKKAALKTAIAQTQTAILELQKKLIAANPKHAAELQAMNTEHNGDLTRLKTARDAAVGTCQGAPQTMGASQMQNGAGQCSGLMKKLNIETQAQQTIEGDIKEKEADIAFTQDLFSAAKSATGGNTSGAKATQSISGAGADVVNILEQLMSTPACSQTGATTSTGILVLTPNGTKWNNQLKTLSPDAARPDSGSSGGSSNNGSATGSGRNSQSGTADGEGAN